MATYTSNYNLEKPAQTDLYNVDVFNDNADIIDSTLYTKSDLSNLATNEPSSTTSRSYAVGEYLTYNGMLYKVTTAIAAGGTITPNGNVAVANVGDQIGEIDAKIKYITNATTGASAVLNVPTGCRCLVVALGGGTQQNAVFAVFKGSATTPRQIKIGGGTATTMTAGSGIVTVVNGDTGNGLYIYGIALNGDLPTA